MRKLIEIMNFLEFDGNIIFLFFLYFFILNYLIIHYFKNLEKFVVNINIFLFICYQFYFFIFFFRFLFFNNIQEILCFISNFSLIFINNL